MARSNDLPGKADVSKFGMIESLQAMLRAFIEYLLVRFQLAGLESKDALRKLIRAILGFVVALLCLSAGFLYLSLSLIYVLAVKLEWGWGWSLFAVGLTLLVAMAIGLLFAKAALKGAWFPTTNEELKKDITWLKSTPTR